MVVRMDGNGVVEEYDGPWRELLVLSEKPHQENKPWSEYQWRMCMYYKKLDQFTWPFTLPITLWNELLQDIDTEENYSISVDMDIGYWQVVAEEEARERL